MILDVFPVLACQMANKNMIPTRYEICDFLSQGIASNIPKREAEILILSSGFLYRL